MIGEYLYHFSLQKCSTCCCKHYYYFVHSRYLLKEIYLLKKTMAAEFGLIENLTIRISNSVANSTTFVWLSRTMIYQATSGKHNSIEWFVPNLFLCSLL